MAKQSVNSSFEKLWYLADEDDEDDEEETYVFDMNEFLSIQIHNNLSTKSARLTNHYTPLLMKNMMLLRVIFHPNWNSYWHLNHTLLFLFVLWILLKKTASVMMKMRECLLKLILINNKLVIVIDITLEQWLDLKFRNHKKVDKEIKEDGVNTDVEFDPTNVEFAKWLASKFNNHKIMDRYTKNALWLYWIRGDDEEVLTDYEFSDLEEENLGEGNKIVEIFRIETDIFLFETPLCKEFKEFNHLLQIDVNVLTRDLLGFKTYEDYKNTWYHEWNNEVSWFDENHHWKMGFGRNLLMIYVMNASRYVSKVDILNGLGTRVGTMVGVDINTLTMEQYLSLSRENQASGMVKPRIGDNVNFEIKSQFMRELREDTFSRNKNEDTHDHIDRVLNIVSLFNISGVSKDAVLLRVFPFTLTGSAKRWVDRLTPGAINTWDLLKKAFIQRYCPPSKTTKQLKTSTTSSKKAKNHYTKLGNGPHLDKECPLNEEVKSVEEVKYDEFGRPAPFNGINRAKFRIEPPGYYTQINTRNQSASLKNLETQIEQLTKELHSRTTNGAPSSSTGQCKVVDADHETPHRPISSSKLKNLHIVSHVQVAQNEEERTTDVLQCQLPPKELNIENFTLPCTIGNFNFYGMADLGASVNVMPRNIFEYLRLANLRNTNILVEMADMTNKAPLGANGDESTSYSTSRGVGEKDDAKQKSDDIRVALKEQENEVLKALYFGKTQGSIELQAFGGLGLLVVPEHQMKNYRDWHLLNSVFLDVPIGQELNSTGTVVLHIHLSQLEVSWYYR
ncbi:hypothetical protein Tco_1361290 [Tanacetum coccineum]